MSTEEKNIQDQQEVHDKLLIDHEYDGIQELDNRPPPWLMLIFYGTIIWAVFYVFYYHVLYDDSDIPDDLKIYADQVREYNQEVADAKVQYKTADFDEQNIKLFTDEAKLAEGMKLWTQKGCLACHGPNGEGNSIGPNLTDNYWLHGNTPADVFKTIKYGVPEKGMTPFKDQMSNEDIQIMTSFILNKLVGSNPANAKEPQGQLYE